MSAPATGTEGTDPLIIDRYAIYDAIAAGGMATVHLGRLIGPAGFLRTVAVKRLHAQYAGDSDFTTMLLDEARLAARIQHPNVVSTLDVVLSGQELLLVMEYIRGESLARLVRRARDRGELPPPRIVVAVLTNALHGLHAAHEAVNEKGQPLGLVHRDMSPQNILVGVDGIARVLDFGIAKAEGRVSSTQDGKIKGKLLYMPAEQLAAERVNRTADIYSIGVVLFEALTCVRMFAGENERAAISKIIHGEIRLPSEIAPELEPFDEVVKKALALNPDDRFQTAAEMAEELSLCAPAAQPGQVGAWVQTLVSDVLDERARMVAEIERSSTRSKPPIAMPGSNPGSGKVQVPQTPSSGRLPEAEPNVTQVLADSPSSPGRTPPPRSSPLAPVAQSPVSEPSVGPTIPVPAPSGPLPQLHIISSPEPKRSPVLLALVVIAGAVVVGLLVVIVMLVMRGAKPAPVADGAMSATVASPPPADSIATVPIVRVPSATPPAEPSEPPKPVAQAPTQAAPTQSSPTAQTAQNPTSRPYVKPVLNCDPPYTIDKNGRKHFIPECVK